MFGPFPGKHQLIFLGVTTDRQHRPTRSSHKSGAEVEDPGLWMKDYRRPNYDEGSVAPSHPLE